MGCGASTEKSLPMEEPKDEEVIDTRSSAEISADKWRTENTKDLTLVKISYEHTFELPFSAENVWSLVSDWNLRYLVDYSSKVIVTPSREPDYPELLCRDVKLPTGEFHEVLLFIDHKDHEVEYVMSSGPVPFSKHFIRFKLTNIEKTESAATPDGESKVTVEDEAHASDKCTLKWTSHAWVKETSTEDHAREVLEHGVVNAIEVITHSLQTRRQN